MTCLLKYNYSPFEDHKQKFKIIIKIKTIKRKNKKKNCHKNQSRIVEEFKMFSILYSLDYEISFQIYFVYNFCKCNNN